MAGNQYCVLWNNYHNALVTTLGGLRRDGELVDITIVCADGKKLRAHQLILAACSNYFRMFLRSNPSQHPIVLLPADIQYTELKAMMQFMYTGQVCITQERLKAFISAARYLHIKGLEESLEDTDVEDLPSEVEKDKENVSGSSSRSKHIFKTSSFGRKVEDQYEKFNEGDSDEQNDRRQLLKRKPVILSGPSSSRGFGTRRKRRTRASMRNRSTMQLSSSVVCYEKSDSADDADRAKEPINKIRRLSTLAANGHFHDDLEICTCNSRKNWSVSDMEVLLKVWRETLTQVPPSYFIRSMGLCKQVARKLQARGVEKNWRQCQVKMKNLHGEVRVYKDMKRKQLVSKKSSEVADACDKLLNEIEDIFQKEEDIRSEWYQQKALQKLREEGKLADGEPAPADLLAQVAVMAKANMCDEEDTDTMGGLDTEGEGGGFTEGEGESIQATHLLMQIDDTTAIHIVEDVSMHVAKLEPQSGTE